MWCSHCHNLVSASRSDSDPGRRWIGLVDVATFWISEVSRDSLNLGTCSRVSAIWIGISLVGSDESFKFEIRQIWPNRLVRHWGDLKYQAASFDNQIL